MHLTQRTYVLLMLTAVLAVMGVWSSDPALGDLWRLPAVLVLIGLAYEGLFIRKTSVSAEVETAPRAFLGRELKAAFTFHNGASRALALVYAPVVPVGVEPVS